MTLVKPERSSLAVLLGAVAYGLQHVAPAAKEIAEAELKQLIDVIKNEKSGDAAVGKVEQLLKKRPELATMQQKESYSRLPLHTAATVDGIDMRIVELLLKAYPQATMQKEEKLGATPLRLAAGCQGGLRGAAVCQLLLQYGPQAAMEKCNEGWFPLHIAAQEQGGDKGSAIVELLLKAAPQACMEKNNNGATPLRVAAYNQGKPISSIFLYFIFFVPPHPRR